jgi:hypothetical protein
MSTRGHLVRLILASGRDRFPDSWSVTSKRPKSMLHILPYPIDLLWRSLEIMSSGESSRKSSRGHVGCQLGRLGPQTGQRVF